MHNESLCCIVYKSGSQWALRYPSREALRKNEAVKLWTPNVAQKKAPGELGVQDRQLRGGLTAPQIISWNFCRVFLFEVLIFC